MRPLTLSLIILSILTISVRSAKILVVAPMPAFSHFTIAFSLAKELADRGHKVTSINPYPRQIPINNYRDVSVQENIEIIEEEKKKLFEQEHLGIVDNLTSFFNLILAITENTLSNGSVQELLHSGESFDAVIIEHFLNEAFVGLGYHFKAPIILLSSVASNAGNNHIFANPYPLSYVPGMGGTLTKHMDFWQRIENVLTHAVFGALVQFYHLPQQRRVFKKFITSDIELDSILYNVSLMLTNSHVSVSDAVPHVPSIIEIGGYHVNPQTLPSDLQSYLDDAKEGVVLFSMGSNLKSTDLKPETRDSILRAFGKIKQKVLWKFETGLSNAPENVKIMDWLPQQDVLAHPNVRAFITHGGFLSTVETVYHGVPIIGIPIFGDQKFNIASAVSNGYAVNIGLEKLTEERLSWALNEVLNNPKYRENAQQRSKLIKDQPLKPMDSAVFWVEHVIRHKGAPHLRSAGLDLNWYQREMVDIFIFLILVVSVISTVFYVAISKLLLFFCSKKAKTVTKTKKNK